MRDRLTAEELAEADKEIQQTLAENKEGIRVLYIVRHTDASESYKVERLWARKIPHMDNIVLDGVNTIGAAVICNVPYLEHLRFMDIVLYKRLETDHPYYKEDCPYQIAAVSRRFRTFPKKFLIIGQVRPDQRDRFNTLVQSAEQANQVAVEPVVNGMVFDSKEPVPEFIAEFQNFFEPMATCREIQ